MSEAAAVVATVPLLVGRYAVFDELAAGGMAKVHLGRLLGPVGFGRTVAVKRLHSHFLKDQEFITMFMDEARIVARIRHPNVVPMADVVHSDEGLFLIMEYVHGESLSRLMRSARQQKEAIDPRIVAAIMSGVLLGLHAAHDTKGADGELLGVVHRDVSPQNIMVGADGAARVLDFGIAKAAGRAQVTREGQIKGKLAYMAPEQIRGQVDRRTDVFAAAVVLWEMLAGRRLHEGAKEIDIVSRVVKGNFLPPSHYAPSLGPKIDAIVLRGLAVDPKARFASARELAVELERGIGLASPSEVTAWVERLAKDTLDARANLVRSMELAASVLLPLNSFVPPAPVETIPVGDLAIDLEDTIESAPRDSAVFPHPQDAAADAPRRPTLASSPFLWALAVSSAVVLLIAAALVTYAAVRTPSPIEPAVTVPIMRRTPPAISQPSAEASPPSSEDKASAPTVTPLVAPVVAAPPVVATPPVVAAPTPLATSTSPSVNTFTPTPVVTQTPKVSPTLPVASVPRPKPKPCEPPYILDENGHRHYKLECITE